MKNHTGGVLYLNENNSATHPEERQRSSINGRVVDGFPIRHPAAPKKEPVPTTGLKGEPILGENSLM